MFNVKNIIVINASKCSDTQHSEINKFGFPVVLLYSLAGVNLEKPPPADYWKIICLSILQEIGDLVGSDKGLLICWERSVCQDNQATD